MAQLPLTVQIKNSEKEKKKSIFKIKPPLQSQNPKIIHTSIPKVETREKPKIQSCKLN